MRTVTLTVSLLTVLCLAAPALSQTGASVPPGSAISGAWRLDHQASDRGAPTGDAGGPGGRHAGPPPGGGGAVGGFGGHGGGSRGGYGQGSTEDRERMKDRMERVRSVMEAAERLTITETPEYVSLVDGDGRVEKLVPNGKKEKHLVGNTQADVRTQWEEGRLVSDIDLGDGVKVKRTISADTTSDGARRLTIELKPEGGMGGGRPPVRRVYTTME